MLNKDILVRSYIDFIHSTSQSEDGVGLMEVLHTASWSALCKTNCACFHQNYVHYHDYCVIMGSGH